MKTKHKICALFTFLLSLGIVPALADTNPNIAPDIAAIQQRGTLRLAIYNLDLVTATGNGITSGSVEIDLANLIAEKLGVKLVVEPVPTYDDVIDLIAANKADLGAELAILPERALRVNFTNPYYKYHPEFLVNRLLSAKYGWNTPDDIIKGMKQGGAKMTIGALQSSASVNIVQANFPHAIVVPYSDPEQSLKDVVSGKIFATMGSAPTDVKAFLNNNPQAGLRAEEVDLTSATLLVAIALPWQDFHLRDWLNSNLNVWQQNGVTTKIFNKYGYNPE